MVSPLKNLRRKTGNSFQVLWKNNKVLGSQINGISNHIVLIIVVYYKGINTAEIVNWSYNCKLKTNHFLHRISENLVIFYFWFNFAVSV